MRNRWYISAAIIGIMSVSVLSGCSKQALSGSAEANTGKSAVVTKPSSQPQGIAVGEYNPNQPVSSDGQQQRKMYPQEIADYIEKNKGEISADIVKVGDQRYVVVFGGTQPTGGYWLELQEFKENDELNTATVLFHKPEKDSMNAEVITYPSMAFALNNDSQTKVILKDSENNSILLEKTIE